ncbi:MAG: alpha/beta fold hydrolase [Alphaproteobacteria bacterium]|nr:alpha/beta fold hydrolase [Alphaproteobacteria bacterium]
MLGQPLTRLTALTPNPMAQARLICFPFAGAGAGAFAAWARTPAGRLETLAYVAPGRETRAAEAPLRIWRDLVADATAACRDTPAGPMAFYGHSLGALLAFDVAASLARTREIATVYIAARSFPSRQLSHHAVAIALSDEDLFDALETEFGAPPPAATDPELRALAAERLRTDLEALSTRPAGAPRRLAARLVALVGEEDPSTKGRAVEPWASATTGDFDIVNLPGGHYFVESARDAVRARILRDVGISR